MHYIRYALLIAKKGLGDFSQIFVCGYPQAMLAIRPKILLDSIENSLKRWRISTDEVEDKGSRGVPLPRPRPWCSANFGGVLRHSPKRSLVVGQNRP